MKCFWFVFCKTDIVLEKTTGGYTIPLLDDCPTPLKEWSQVLEIGTMPDDGTPIKAVSIDMPLTDSPIFEMCGLRNSYYKLSKALYLMAGKMLRTALLEPKYTFLWRLWDTYKAAYQHIETLSKLWKGGVATSVSSSHSTGASC